MNFEIKEIERRGVVKGIERSIKLLQDKLHLQSK
jgi:hypothetical protein